MVAPVVVFSSRFKVAFVAIWKVSCGEFRECFTRCAIPQLARNVSNFYIGQVVSLMNEQPSQNLLLKVDPLSTIRNNELLAQGEELETSVESFCIE